MMYCENEADKKKNTIQDYLLLNNTYVPLWWTGTKYSVIQKDRLNFVRLYFLNCTRYVNDLHNILKRRSNFQTPLLKRSSSAQPCSSASWEQNGYYAAQNCLRVWEENVRRIQESFDRSPRKSTRRASRELGIPQSTVWRVLSRRSLFNWVHLFESPYIYVEAM